LWRTLFLAALGAVSDARPPIPVVLLGTKAIALASAIAHPNTVIEAGHPTPPVKPTPVNSTGSLGGLPFYLASIVCVVADEPQQPSVRHVGCDAPARIVELRWSCEVRLSTP